MPISRRHSLKWTAFALGLASFAGSAQAWPERPIRIIVPFGAGSFPDVVARVVGDKMSAGLRQPIVVENRPGAGGNIGTEAVINAAPDGYTLLLHSVANATSKGLYRNLPFDPLRDLKPITQLAQVGNVLVVTPSLPVSNFAQFLELSKRPKGLTYASGGNGTTSHLAVELLRASANANLVHAPYKNFGQALTDVMAGQPEFVMPNIPPTVAHIKGGKLKPIAVTSARRSPLLPDVPTLAESGVAGFDVTSWNGLAAPAATPDAIIRRIHDAAIQALADPEVRQKLGAQGAELVGSTPAEYEAFTRAETEKWARVIEKSGAKLD
jgi:tripartite-type tricarboxylate transporter receptor subunit TctC